MDRGLDYLEQQRLHSASAKRDRMRWSSDESNELESEHAKRVRRASAIRKRVAGVFSTPAERAFALRGFGGARLRDIAQEAGVHHALVHHYYGDKRGLLEEVIQRGLERMAEAARAALTAPLTLEGTVRAFVGVAVRLLRRQPRPAAHHRRRVSQPRAGVVRRHARRRSARSAARCSSRLKLAIEHGQKHGHVRTDISADSLILLGFGAIVYRFDMAESLLTAMGLAKARSTDIAAEREHAIQYVLSAMRPQK